MGYVLLSDSEKVVDGLRKMLVDMDEDYIEYIPSKLIEIEKALFIIVIAKKGLDKEEYFPRGRWATIQAIEERIAAELDRLIFSARSTRGD
jgi:hypothetical protein